MELIKSIGRKDVLEHADEKVSECVSTLSLKEGGEDESVNERVDDIEIPGADGCSMKDGMAPLLNHTLEYR